MRNEYADRRQATERSSPDDRVDIICDRFEAAYLRGEFPRMEEFLTDAAADDRRSLFSELAILDFDYRRRRGRPASLEEYLRRFPGFAAEIEAVGFAGHWDDTVVEDQHVVARQAMAGRRFARFNLISKLGAGAAGEVWKAHDQRLDRVVAIKIPHRSQLEEPELRRFLREARAAAQLRHPNIVSIHEAGREGNDAYIASDYIDGQTLRERLRAGPLTFQAAAEICASIADALHYAHEAGIIHRDVKPANVILDGQGRPHVTDFGLAKWSADAQELTLHGELIGTPSYMSPEQASGSGASVDGRADIFSLGVMLYEMLAGHCPFQGDQSTVVRAIVESEPIPPRIHNRGIPRNLETICLKALEKNPDRRYATAQALALDLRRFLRGEPILARRRGLLSTTWASIKRRPMTVAASVLLVLATCASAMAAWMAKENRQLQGYRTVMIETVPSGARVAFVPLDRATGEPRREQAIRAGDDEIIVEQLKPGDYLVVAALADGRFHEVYRHVPDPLETMPLSHKHRRFQIQTEGSVELPKITIPAWKVDESMAYFAGSQVFEMGVEGSDQVPRHRRAVAPFYMDRHEFMVADARSKGEPPFAERLPGEAVSVDFDWAVAFAESRGKRLPTESEYEFAATAGGASRFPWGHKLEAFRPTQFETAPYDRHVSDHDLKGLCSNKAEWTMSWSVGYPPRFARLNRFDPRDWRVIRGGNLHTAAGDPSVTVESRDPRARHVVERYRTLPGVGFRCVRSEFPLLTYEEME